MIYSSLLAGEDSPNDPLSVSREIKEDFEMVTLTVADDQMRINATGRPVTVDQDQDQDMITHQQEQLATATSRGIA